MKTLYNTAKVLITVLVLTINTNVMSQQVEPRPFKGQLDPQISKGTKEFLAALNTSGGAPLETLSPEKAREVLVSAQKSVEVDYSGIEESQREITHKGQTLTIHIVKPKGAKENLPVFMFFHGGGWILGDYPTHRRLVRDLVVSSGAVAVFPDYTPSPEARYPVAIHQAYAATAWVAAYGNEIGVDGKRLAVVGNSVGGNMAAVVALLAKDENGPQIRQQILLWPVTDANFTRPSYTLYAKERFLTTSMMKWMWDNYLPEASDRKEIYASPFQASLTQLRDLPPALVQLAENDILYDEGLAYGRKLDQAGVPTTITTYNGMIHDFGLLNPLAEEPAAKVALLQAASVLKDALFNQKN